MLTGGSQDTQDILQDANLRIMELLQDDELPAIDNFRAWTRKVVYFQVLTWRKDHSRERIVFDSDALEKVASALEDYGADSDERVAALEYCMKLLPQQMRTAIQERYQPGGSVKLMAKKLNVTPHTITMRLYHARLALKECITKRLSPGGQHG